MKLNNLPIRHLSAVFISLFLIALVFWLPSVENVLQRLAGFPPWALAGILALLLANLFVVSFRFWRVLAHFGIALPWKVVSRACVAGHATGLVVISLFGQVMGRQAVLQKCGVQPVVNASLAAYERTLLALVSGALGILGGFYLLGNSVIDGFFQNLSLIEIVIAALGGGALSLWLGRSRFETKLSGQMFSWANSVRVMSITGLTLAGQLLILGCFVLGIIAVSPDVPVASLFAASAIISLAASMPITVNGWGVRELAAVYVLGKLGVPATDAVAVSVIIGLCSTLVILAATPFAVRTSPMSESAKPLAVTVHPVSEIEKSAAWILGIAVAVAVFFQVHLSLPGGVINLNLADPFAILALAAVSLHALFSKQMPAWKIRHFNLALGAISLLMLLGFINGWLKIGVTQWALGGRLLGWLVLLGYLSAGYLIVANAGAHGLRRLAETLIATAAVVVVLQATLRLLEYWGVNTGAHFAPNFEGYASNRNAFAFQLLAVMALLLGYSRVYARCSVGSYLSKRPLIFSVLLGIVLAGLVWTGSRAGLLVGLTMLFVAGIGRLADRRMLGWGLIFAATLWVGVWMGMQSVSIQSASIQSAFSGDHSNQQRWASLTYGLELWRQSPVFGAGLGVFIAKSSAWFGFPQVIHNTPIWILAEFGLVGMAVLGWTFFLLSRYAIPLKTHLPARRVLLLIILAFAIFSMAHEIFYQRVLWLVLGAVLAQPFVSRARA
ncbi:MAG: lysylphosphatidylglycerol synthase domain-containing protein [Thiobacillus sp.]|nr:lysylphosphatidylglycerol synthase domain-containing protein [Thiobacillus sp.]